MSAWQTWLQHPERLWLRHVLFQVHLWTGAAAGLYVCVMSISGSILVYRNDISRRFDVAWLVDLHANLLFGMTGRVFNGIGALCLSLLCMTGIVIWWPGIPHWRRSLTVSWRVHLPRFMWDLHSAFGFWCFLIVLLWGLSGTYFSFPQPFNALFFVDPQDKFTDESLFWLSALHFGRFGWLAQLVWCTLGLGPALLSLSGIFICCRRVIYQKPSNPHILSQ